MDPTLILILYLPIIGNAKTNPYISSFFENDPMRFVLQLIFQFLLNTLRHCLTRDLSKVVVVAASDLLLLPSLVNPKMLFRPFHRRYPAKIAIVIIVIVDPS
jgi:hypothetical protein